MESTNDKIINLSKKFLGNAKFGIIIQKGLQKRLDIGDIKFGQPMPFGKYRLEDAKEEIEDAFIYISSIKNLPMKNEILQKLIDLLNIFMSIEEEKKDEYPRNTNQRAYLER